MAPHLDTDLAETARQLRMSVVRLGRRLRRLSDNGVVSPLGISVLGRLYQHRAMTPRALGNAEHISPQTLTRVLAALEERGLIAREVDPTDRRQVLLELTPDGREVLREDTRRREEWLAQAMVTALSPAEREMLRVAATLLDRLA